jgi:hypothetical protein
MQQDRTYSRYRMPPCAFLPAQSPEAAQSLQSMKHDLATMAHEIEQLKANQEQMSRDIAKLPEQNPRPKRRVRRGWPQRWRTSRCRHLRPRKPQQLPRCRKPLHPRKQPEPQSQAEPVLRPPMPVR